MKKLFLLLVLAGAVVFCTTTTASAQVTPKVTEKYYFIPCPNPRQPEGVGNERELYKVTFKVTMPICCITILEYEWTECKWTGFANNSIYTTTTTSPSIDFLIGACGTYNYQVKVKYLCNGVITYATSAPIRVFKQEPLEILW